MTDIEKKEKIIDTFTQYYTYGESGTINIIANDVVVSYCGDGMFKDTMPNIHLAVLSTGDESIEHLKLLEGELGVLIKNFKSVAFAYINARGELIIIDKNPQRYYINAMGELIYDWCIKPAPDAILQEDKFYLLQEDNGKLLLENG